MPNIPAVLIYARNQGRILMIHRDAPERAQTDFHAGKWNGLGGKQEAGETFVQTASREFFEESGLRIENSRFRDLGVLQFPNFKPLKGEDWTVHVFYVDIEDSELVGIKTKSEEGSLHWIAEGEVLKLNLWPGDHHFIPYVLVYKPFMGTIWYEDGKVSRYEIRAV